MGNTTMKFDSYTYAWYMRKVNKMLDKLRLTEVEKLLFLKTMAFKQEEKVLLEDITIKLKRK